MLYDVTGLLDRAAGAHPDRIALADDKKELSYREYREKAMAIAAGIEARAPGERRKAVAVLIDRNVESIICFLGAAYSGNYYVPVDMSLPEERISLIYERTSPLLIIDARNKKNDVPGAVSFETIVSENGGKAYEPSVNIDTDPLYAIFTSGSTGIPKGVLISHRSVLDMVQAFEEAFHFDEGTVFANQAPFDFDVSVKDIYNSLYVGGRVEVLPKKLFKMPKLLTEHLRERKADTIIWAVSALRIVADFKTFDVNEPPQLKNVMFSGEAMPGRVLAYWREHIPEARYVNLYGPTEITCNCTYHEIKEAPDPAKAIPIGKPFVNSRVFLRDEEGRRVSEKNVIGEICIAGSCLALGYINDSSMTERAFIQDPLAGGYRSEVYVSGDLGYYNDRGELVFAGRRDSQIKHMGHRIELGELELVLNSVGGIDTGCCLYDASKEAIVCFYQSAEPRRKEILEAFAKKLPKYMRPTEYVRYRAIPMNKNAKIDRALLKQMIKEGNYGSADKDNE